MTSEIFDRKGLSIVSAARHGGPVLSVFVQDNPATLTDDDARALRRALGSWLGNWREHYPIERVHEPSHVRRGRLSVDPVWYVTAPDGKRTRFTRQRDAKAFVATCLEEAKAAREETGGAT